jgi:STE24 endopeptidase
LFYFQVIILTNGFVHFWNFAGVIVSTLGYDTDNEILRSAAFMLTLNIFNTITSLPFSIYHTFVLEERHGFNKQVSEVVVWV